jgi:hypothetical protein
MKLMKHLIALLTLCSSLYSATPNILFAIADDWGPHASAYGTPWVKTPSFDRVAKEGLLFRHAYTPNAKCAPSRACILTGRNSWQLKEAANHICYFPPEFKGWGEALAEKGWNVGQNEAKARHRRDQQLRLRGELHRLPRCRAGGKAVVLLVWGHRTASRL